MKFACLVSACIASVSASVSDCDAARAYIFGLTISDEITISPEDAFLVWADAFSVAGGLDVGSSRNTSAVFTLLESILRDIQKPRLLVSLHGALEDLLSSDQQSFSIDCSTALYASAEHMLLEKVPRLILEKQDTVQHSHSLTKEIRVLANEQSPSVKRLTQHFAFYFDQAPGIWKKFTNRISLLSGENSDDSLLSEHHAFGTKSSSKLNLMTDKFYISELSQLVHLERSAHLADATDVFVVDLHALTSVAKRTGRDLATYKLSNKVMGEMLQKLLQVYDVHLLVAPPPHCGHLARSHRHLARRSALLDAEAGANKQGSCYALLDACDSATGGCLGHGTCVTSDDKCWLCACVATFNSTTQRTSVWTGPECAKRDVAWQANLFLWLSLALLIVLFMGIKLVASVGSEPLPGVLDTASLPRKS